MIVDKMWIDIIAYISLGLSLMSFLFKDAQRTKQTIACSQFFMASHYGLLMAWTSAVLQAVLMCRSLASSFTKTLQQKHVVFVITIISLLALTAYTWDGVKSLLPLAGAGVASVALCYCNNKWMRILLIFGSVLWFFNAYIWDSVPLMVAEAVKMVFNTVTVYRLNQDEKSEIRGAENVTASNVSFAAVASLIEKDEKEGDSK